MNYPLHLGIYLALYLIAAFALNIVSGYCGLLTLAHSAYFAIGAYVYALLALRLGWGVLIILPIAILFACITSLFLSLPSWRFKGDYFVLISIIVQVVVYGILYNWFEAGVPIGTWRNLTNGPFGIPGIPKPVLFGIRLDTLYSIFAFSSLAAGLCGILYWRLTGSPWGRLLICLRDDEVAARACGKNTRLCKVQAISISCAMVAVSGVTYAIYTSYVDPSMSSLDGAMMLLGMALVGGTKSVMSPFAGAAFMVFVPELLRFAGFPGGFAGNLRIVVFGLLLVLFAHSRSNQINA